MNGKAHGMSKTKLYRTWANVKRRCGDVKGPYYLYYRARGIRVCEEWSSDFTVFYDWSVSNGYEEGLQLDRVDNNEGYCPENCRWTTRSVNAQNTRIRRDNTTGYRGVYWHNNVWEAKLMSDKKQFYIGSYHTAKEAAIAYNNWVIEHGTFHTLNEIT